MVVSFLIHHIYQFPVEQVIRTYLEKHKREDHKSSNVELVCGSKETGMECVKLRVTFSNFFPSFFRLVNALKTDTVVMEEECWSEDDNRRHWVRSRNITWEDEAVIYHSAFLSPDPQNDQWTRWEQDSTVDFGSFGKLGIILELYLKRYFENKMRTEFRYMEKIMSK